MASPTPPAVRRLDRPPEEGARLLALAFLDQAAAARPRLRDPDDTEALHDFRVGLRRLRSCLQAYRSYLKESIGGKLEKKLKALADATGAGRDTEVEIAWLRGRTRHLGSYHRLGLAWLLERLEARKEEAYGDVAAAVDSDFAGLEHDLRRRLSVYRTEVRLDAPPERETLAAAAAGILAGLAADLGEALEKVEGAGDEETAHRARIRAKRLRYLLEPLAEELPAAKPAVKHLKELQELLGELHDAHVLEQELGEALEAAGAERGKRLFDLTLADAPDEALLRAERRRPRDAGLLTLAKLNRARRDRLFAELEAGWLGGNAAGFLGEMEELAARLQGAPEEAEAALGTGWCASAARKSPLAAL